MALAIRALDAADNCSSLSLGEASLQRLKTFLKRDAQRYHRENVARTFVVTETGQRKVKAYLTLVCTHVEVGSFEAAPPLEGYRHKEFPAVKLARLAVDSSLQRQGIGGQLVDFALGIVIEQVMPHAGCRFLILDAKPTSVSFYKAKGFKTIGDIPDDGETLTVMAIDLHRLDRK